jgi:hypothetical protein
MIAERVRRRPTTIGFVGKVEQPLLDHIVRLARKILLNIRDRDHV